MVRLQGDGDSFNRGYYCWWLDEPINHGCHDLSSTKTNRQKTATILYHPQPSLTIPASLAILNHHQTSHTSIKLNQLMINPGSCPQLWLHTGGPPVIVWPRPCSWERTAWHHERTSAVTVVALMGFIRDSFVGGPQHIDWDPNLEYKNPMLFHR